MLNSPTQKKNFGACEIRIFKFDLPGYKNWMFNEKKEIPENILLGLHTILAVIKWILGSRTIFHFTVSSPGAEWINESRIQQDNVEWN